MRYTAASVQKNLSNRNEYVLPKFMQNRAFKLGTSLFSGNCVLSLLDYGDRPLRVLITMLLMTENH